MRKLFFVLAILSTISSFSQVSIDASGNYSNPSYLIDNVLIGSGVISSNHNFIGDSSQIGYFTDNSGLIGMDSGFVLSTGGVDSIGVLGGDTLWWDYIWDSTFTVIIDSTPFVQNYFLSSSLFGSGDPDLLTIANSVPALIGQSFVVSSTGDAVVLEFDFVPSYDTVEFRYVFASEEYLSFVNSSFNDVFAFLISGPGITGPYISPSAFPGGAINIAVVPNTNPVLPVTISTVNDQINSQYYNHDTLSSVTAFNGFTDVFTAQAAVIPCEIYHIKLAIADGTDNGYDSGVFFESGSFSSEPGAPNVMVNTTDVICYGDSTGTASVCIQGGVGPYVIDWNGENPIALSGGTYFVNVTDALGNIVQNSYTIYEPSQIGQIVDYDGFILSTIAMGGNPSYLYEWILNGNIVSTSMNYTPTQNGDYICIVTDASGCINSSNIVNVSNATGISNLLSKSLIIHPNPFTQNTTINLLNPHDVLLSVSLYDPAGRKVKDFNISKQKQSIILEKGNLTEGIYMLVVQTNNYISKSKLVIR